MGGGSERRRIGRFSQLDHPNGVWSFLSAFEPNAFICETALLDRRLTSDLNMNTAEDSALQLGLFAKSPARFNYAASAVRLHVDEGSQFLQDPKRPEDELTLLLTHISELDTLFGPEETRLASASTLVRALSHKDSFVQRLGRRAIFRSDKVDYSDVPPSTHPSTRVPLAAAWVKVHGGSHFLKQSNGAEASFGKLVVIPPEIPWHFGAEIDLGARGLLSNEGMLLVRGCVEAGLMGFTLFEETEREPLFRCVLAADNGAFDLHVPLIKGSRIGKLVAQNWADGRPCRAIIESVSVPWPVNQRSQAPGLSRSLKRLLRRVIRAGVAWIRSE
jgi:hypothetical protein